MSRRLVVISGGLSQPSSTRLLADRIAGAVSREVTARGEGLDVEVVELRPLARDIADHLVTGMPSARLRDALAAVSGAAAVVAVTPVFTASYSGLFKSFVDLLDPGALTGTPVLIAATAGTARHSLVLDYAMRPLFSYLRAQVVPTGVFAATEDFGADGLTQRVARAAAEFATVVLSQGGYHVGGFSQDLAARPARTSGARIDEDVTPFSQLLEGHSG